MNKKFKYNRLDLIKLKKETDHWPLYQLHKDGKFLEDKKVTPMKKKKNMVMVRSRPRLSNPFKFALDWLENKGPDSLMDAYNAYMEKYRETVNLIEKFKMKKDEKETEEVGSKVPDNPG